VDHHAVAGDVSPELPAARQLLVSLRSTGLNDLYGVAGDGTNAAAPLFNPRGPRVIVDIVGANDHRFDVALAVGLADRLEVEIDAIDCTYQASPVA
jgi:hypothetical protein